MKNTEEMYYLLTKLIEATEARDEKLVNSLNDRFEILYVESIIGGKNEYCNYDNCRQSCMMAFKNNVFDYDMCLVDAKSRFSKLSL